MFPLGIRITRAFYQRIPVSMGESAAYLGFNLMWIAAGVTFFNRMLEQERRRGSFDHF